jgi:hypothetical protein
MPQQETKQCQNCGQPFIIEPEDFDFYEKINVPPPVACLNCRTSHRLAFWPFGKFNKRTCDLTGERIISLYPPKTPFPVYRHAEWYSDKWQAPAMVYDPNRPFFDQLYELQTKTPRDHQLGSQNVGCDWCDDVWECKNCYLCRSLLNCENLFYSYRTIRCRDSYDVCYCFDADQCYDCTYCFKVFNVKYAFDVRDSMDSVFLYDCRNVHDCFMCWNLRNREYCILNQPYSKEEYFRKLGGYRLDSRESLEMINREFQELLRTQAVHRASSNIKSVNSTGNYLTECKNCRECYFFEESENCAYMFRGPKNKDCYDSAGILRGELIYNTNQFTEGYRVFHSNYSMNCRESEYLDSCSDCQYCFGCVGLRNKKFCVLNKPYPEAEYQALVAKIKEKMTADGVYGRFFPYKMACGGYNLSVAGIFFPKTKEEVVKLGGLWEEAGISETEGRSVYDPPDSIRDTGEEAIGKAVICRESGRAFSVTKDELSFLKKKDIPLPREYPDVRTLHRIQRLFCITAHPVTCHFCGKEIISFYPPEWKYEKIVCEDCYLKEVT